MVIPCPNFNQDHWLHKRINVDRMYYSMKPGDLVQVPEDVGHAYMYDHIDSGPRSVVGILSSCIPVLVIDSGISPSDIPYVKVVTTDGIIGWIRDEKLKVLMKVGDVYESFESKGRRSGSICNSK